MADCVDPDEDADLLATVVALQRYESRSTRHAAAEAMRARRRADDDHAAG